MSKEHEGRAVVSIGYINAVLPMNDAIELFKHLQKVEFLESEYKNRMTSWFFNESIEVTLKVFTNEQYAKAKLYTERKNDEHAS